MQTESTPVPNTVAQAPEAADVGLQQVNSAPRPKVVGRPFKPGQSGNPSGRRRGSVSLRSAIMRQLSSENCNRIASVLVRKAASGDLAAVRTLLQAIGEWQSTVHMHQDAPLPARDVSIDMEALRRRVEAAVEGEERMKMLIERGLVAAPSEFGGNGGNGHHGGGDVLLAPASRQKP